MNGGALVTPFIAGAIYDHAGYYAVWGVCLGVIGFDFILRMTMIEKSRAKKWLEHQGTDFRETRSTSAMVGNTETDRLLSNDTGSDTTISSQETQTAYGTPHTNEPISSVGGSQQPRETWLARTFPAMTILLRSPRIFFSCRLRMFHAHHVDLII